MDIKGKHILALVLIAAAVWLAAGDKIGPVLHQWALVKNQGTGAGTEVQEGQTTITQEGDKITQIIAISSVKLQATFIDALNESTHYISPDFYIWREGSTHPTKVDVTDGKAEVSVRPGEKIRYAAGKDGEYYWTVGSVKVGTVDTPIEVELYKVPSANGVRLKIFDDSYNDLTDGNMNLTVGTGDDFTLVLQVDDKDEYTAIYKPTIVVEYDINKIGDVRITGTKEVDVPTRLIPNGRQAFEIKNVKYYTYEDPKMSFDVAVDVLSGASLSGSYMKFYIVDKDVWYKDGEDYFINPFTRTDMGSQIAWNATVYFE